MLKRILLVLLLAAWHGAATAQDIKLSVTEGTNFSADLSADGKQLVIDLLGSLWLVATEGGTAKRLTDPAKIEARLPQWSPHDEQIAFQGFKDGYWHIFTLAPDEDAPRQLTMGRFDNREPRWHPDGNRLVFTSDRDGPEDVYALSLSNMVTTRLTTKTAPTFGGTWSHGGKTLAYVEAAKSRQKIILRGEDGTERLLLERPGAIDGVSWHPNDTSLTFVQTLNEEAGLFLADLSSDGVLDISNPGDDIFPFAAIWQDDTHLIYTADGKIKTLAIDTFQRGEISFDADILLKRQNYTRKDHNFTSANPQPVKGLLGPVLSPDGGQIAFTALGDLWIQTIGGSLEQVTNSPFVELDPHWSNDGSSLFYVSDEKGVMDIWRLTLDSGETERLTQLQSGATAPVLSPDGQSIAFIQALGNAGLGPALPAVLDLTTGKSRPLSSPLWGPGRPSWSPDGQWITLSAQPDPISRVREGLNQVLLISKDGKSKTWLAPPNGKSLAMRNRNGPLWLDNATIVFVQGGALWRMSIDPVQKSAGDQALILLRDGIISSISLSADGQTLSFLENDALNFAELSSPSNFNDPQPVTLDLKWTRDIPTGKKIVHAGRLFDGENDSYQTDVDILISGNVITSITPHSAHDDDVPVIDASRQTVIPGLFDMHVHQHAGLGERLGRIWLAFGVTSVREPGANPYDALERKESWANGTRPGPRQFFAGGQLDGPRTYFAFSHPTSSLAQVEREMKRAETLDYDFIKTYIRLSEDHRQKVIETAHKIGLPVTAHDFFPAAAFGGDGVEHMRGTSRRGFSPKLSNTNRAYGDVIKVIGGGGMTQTPTLVVRGGFASLAQSDPSILATPQYQSLFPEGQRKMMEGMAFGIAGDLTRARTRLDRHYQDIRSLRAEGARITAGTDVPIVPYGLSLLVELQLLQEAGLTPAEALRSAGLNAARDLGVEKWLGSITAGKLADLVIVDGDPLANVAETRQITKVIKNGEVFEIDSLTKP